MMLDETYNSIYEIFFIDIFFSLLVYNWLIKEEKNQTHQFFNIRFSSVIGNKKNPPLYRTIEILG